MIYNDMDLKRKRSMEIVHRAIEKGHGHTILSTGITGDDARLARAAVEAGATMLEPNHPAVVLARGHRGITVMHDAENYRHEITIDQMAEVTRGVRAVVGEDIYITVGIPGSFTERQPVILTDADMQKMMPTSACPRTATSSVCPPKPRKTSAASRSRWKKSVPI